MIKKILKLITPPIVVKILSPKRKKGNYSHVKKFNGKDPEKQDLELYWDQDYAKILEEWGKDSTWNEIQMILATSKGKVLDIACGTGITIKLLEKFKGLDLHGFDISDVLIQKAIEKNIPRHKLKVIDATKTDYQDDEFDYSYSIGSLEHFTLEGIDSFVKECARYTKIGSFHMVPVSRSNTDEGWMKTTQSFFNNSEKWWYSKFKKEFSQVYSIASKWEDPISHGRWFICIK
jgi:ubiquinone/menaquinone biosynthesis C-methylase UbiE